MSPFTGSAARTSDWQHLRCEVADGVATVTLARRETQRPHLRRLRRPARSARRALP